MTMDYRVLKMSQNLLKKALSKAFLLSSSSGHSSFFWQKKSLKFSQKNSDIIDRRRKMVQVAK
jgi:hypothetical protein